MKLRNSFFLTLKENQKEEDSKSGNLLVRSGMIKKAGNGIYYFLPLGLKVVKKIENIIREEMNKTGAEELIMPSLLPEDVYVASGRRDVFGNDMFSLKDRYNREYVLGPTHEEMFVAVAKDVIHSYKDMPINLYQIANKYRDEPRPRYGLIRVREFVMKDAYSFDIDEENLEISYQKMYKAYQNIFDRIGINYKIVKASTGAMGGLLSEEFQAITDIGEDIIVLCDTCDYSSNLEIATCIKSTTPYNEDKKETQLLHTPDICTIESLKEFGIDIDHMVKTLIYKAENKFYACLVKGNREINELKLCNILNTKEISLADIEEVELLTNAKIGFAGPIRLDLPIIMDEEILDMKNFLVGANKTDYHYINTNLEDFKYDVIGDIKNVQENDTCSQCGGKLEFKKGIEIGNTFKLGTKYSHSLGLTYLDSNNQQHPVVMGCYGIGVGRILAAIVEQTSDENGLILPKIIAPYQVAIVLININDEKQKMYAEKLYQELTDKSVEVILDNRDIRPGVKFKDMDLIGIPLKITIGSKIEEGCVEYKERSSNNVEIISVNEIVNKVSNFAQR